MYFMEAVGQESRIEAVDPRISRSLFKISNSLRTSLSYLVFILPDGLITPREFCLEIKTID